MLKAKKPSTVEKRLKCLLYGSSGSGKTTASIQFPKPYLVDTERGAENEEYTTMLESQGGVILQTTDYNELIEEVKSLLSEKHDYKTLIIDPLTTIYNSMLDDAERRVGNEFGRHFGDANKKIKHLLDLLLRLDMNVIITSHSKNEYGDAMKVIGQTFDCYKKLDYLFDLVLEIKKIGKQRIAVVKKSRIKTFDELESFTFSYDAIADKYGRSILEKDAVAQKLATSEQVSKLNHLLGALKIEAGVTEKWLEKSGADSFEEMEEIQIKKCIDFLEAKINPAKEVA